MTKNEMLEKIISNDKIKEIIEIFPCENKKYQSFFNNNTTIVGGCLIDILEDRIPKDFDVISSETTPFEKLKFIYSTKTADTFETESGLIIQKLKTQKTNFDFKISTVTLEFQSANKLEIDEVSFNQKTLIPISFENANNCLNSLRRIPHWQKKGYSINDKTYLSLLNQALKINHKPINS